MFFISILRSLIDVYGFISLCCRPPLVGDVLSFVSESVFVKQVKHGLQNRVTKSGYEIGEIAKIGKSGKTKILRKHFDVVKKNPRSAPEH